jgi:hypothetical protein
MRSGFATAIVLVSLALVTIVGWAASRAPAPAAPGTAVATTKPAPPPPPPCLPADLGVTYLTGHPEGGSDSGIIAIWDRSARSCSLTGPIVVSGLDPAGHLMTTVVSYQVGVASTLTARGTRPRAGLHLPAGERAAPLVVSAGYKLDAGHRYRPCAQQTQPATWQLEFPVGGALAVANADPRASVRHVRGLPANHGLLTCRGVLDAPYPVEVIPPA